MVAIRTLRYLLVICIIGFIATLFPFLSHAQEPPTALVRDISNIGASNAKYPQLAVNDRGVYISAVDEISASNDGKAKLWIKGEEDEAFQSPLVLGSVTRGTIHDHVQTSVTTAPTGEVYVMWIDQVAKTIKLRRREPDGSWNPVVFEVMRGHNFAAEPALAVRRTDGQIVAAWREAALGRINYTYSNNRGLTWAPVREISTPAYKMQQTAMAAGPNGEIVLLFIRDNPRPIHVMATFWSGTVFGPPRDINSDPSQISQAYGDASATFTPEPAPNTRIVIGYRHVDEGIFLIEKPVSEFSAPWNPVLLASGKGDSRVSVDYDQNSNLHVSWIRSNIPGNRRTNQIHYTMKPAGRNAFLPIATASQVWRVFSAFGKAREGLYPYMHVAYEIFTGESQIPILGYAQFRGPRPARFSSPPVIEDGTIIVSGDGRTTINVKFPNLTSSFLPDQVRWRWGAPPTDTETDSDGWVPFAPSLSVPIPEAMRTDAGCVERTLYTQLRNVSNNFTDQVYSDTVILDLGVNVTVIMGNPFSRIKTSPFTGASLIDMLAEGGASDGHPDYSRERFIFTEIRDAGDCSGLRSFRLAPNTTSLGPYPLYEIRGGRFANIIAYPHMIPEGPMPVAIQIRDAMNNSVIISRTFIYDRTAPVLNSGNLQAQPISGAATMIVSLQFTDLSVTDNLYPGRGFWGVWLANSRAARTNPATDPQLVWTPVEAPGEGNSFTVVWSLATGLPEDQLTPGTYYIYARVLDGAGNPSATVLPVAEISIDEVTFPQMFLPIINR